MGIVNRVKNKFWTGQSKSIFVVTSNCQTHGIASSIDLMLPDSEAVPIWSLSGLDYVVEQINSKIKGDFIWLTILNEVDRNAVIEKLAVKPSQVLSIPEIFFDAFHPDMTYVQLRNGELLESALGHYHSKIALWLYLNGGSTESAMKYFTGSIYMQLGYMGKHEISMAGLKNTIIGSGLDLALFNETINHSDSFMHTFNHPKLKMLAALAEAACFKLGLIPTINHTEVDQVLRDVLFESGPIFPIYPEIASYYGLEGSYLLRRQDGRVLTFPEFTSESFKIYARIKTDQFNPQSLFTQNFNDTMNEIVGAS